MPFNFVYLVTTYNHACARDKNGCEIPDEVYTLESSQFYAFPWIGIRTRTVYH
jgi:hypothetical protein